MRTFKQDYATGTANEKRCIEFLNYYFDEEFEKLPPMHPFDFVSKNRYVEVKSRTNNKSTYPTTMIGYDKIEFAKKCDKPVHFAFLFKDNSFWEIEYKHDLFETFECNLFQRENRSDHTYVRKQYCYIPVSKLEDIGMILIILYVI